MGQKKEDLQEFARRLEVVKESTTMRAAGEKLGIDGDRLRMWFARRDIDARLFLLKAAPEVVDAPPTTEEVDPVERRQSESKQARIVRENKTMADELANLREMAAFTEQLASAPLPTIARREFKSGMREATAVAMLSDLHVEERVKPGDTPIGNAYNLNIADLRLGRYFSGVEWLIGMHRQRFAVRDLLLWVGGDTFSGHIHDENVETSALTPIAACLWLQPRLIAGIEQLRDRLKLERVHVVCSYGNHGRDTKKPRRATGAHHSYEWMMYQQIAQHFAKDQRVRVLADASAHQYARVYDFDLHFHHGDETSYQGGVGGITIPLNKAVAQWDKARHAHYHHFGHWHQYLDTGNMVVNGSLIGFNAYAMSIKASPEPPQQAFYLLDSKRGKTCKAPVWVGDASEELKLWKDVA